MVAFVFTTNVWGGVKYVFVLCGQEPAISCFRLYSIFYVGPLFYSKALDTVVAHSKGDSFFFGESAFRKNCIRVVNLSVDLFFYKCCLHCLCTCLRPIWPNSHSAEYTFGRMTIWPSDRKTVWPNDNSAELRFGRINFRQNHRFGRICFYVKMHYQGGPVMPIIISGAIYLL